MFAIRHPSCRLLHWVVVLVQRGGAREDGVAVVPLVGPDRDGQASPLYEVAGGPVAPRDATALEGEVVLEELVVCRPFGSSARTTVRVRAAWTQRQYMYSHMPCTGS